MNRYIVYALCVLVVVSALVGIMVWPSAETAAVETIRAKADTGSGFSGMFYLAMILIVAIAAFNAFRPVGTAGTIAQVSVSLVAALIIGFGALDYFRFGNQATAVRQELQARNVQAALEGEKKSSTDAPGITVEEPSWADNRSSTTIPVGKWSETYKVERGCNTRFDGGNTVVYKIRYSLYGSPWEIHRGKGHHPSFDRLEFMALRKGLTKIPFTLTCS